MDHKTAHILNEKERTEDIEIQENVLFSDMYLSDTVLAGLHAAGFVRPSPIQLQSLPLGMCGLDLIVQAKSGTGKTCVFTVVALEMVSVIAKTTQVLVVAPTREIAVQISQVINTIGSSMIDLRASTFIGGVDLSQDKAKLKCCHIAIGTPGRLNQLVSLGILNLTNVRLLILDEADQLLTGQFKDSILQLVTTLPLNKQVLALSATYPSEVTNFLDKFMRSPTQVRLGKESPALIGVNQFVRLVPDHPQPHHRHKIKMNELFSILASTSFNQCLVFSNSQLRAESICNQLRSQGWPAAYLSGGLPQHERLQAFQDLCTYKCRILVSTDLSARGLDSEHVNLVINLDVPNEQATYLHRIGRAGRFGSKGGAITIVCEGDEWEAIQAITTLANVKAYIMTEDWSSGINLPENVEELKKVSEKECAIWVEKQNNGRTYSKKKNKSSEISGDINKVNGCISKSKENGLKKQKHQPKSSESTSSTDNNDNIGYVTKDASVVTQNEIKKLFLQNSSSYDSFKCKFNNKKIMEECLSNWESLPYRDSSIVKLKDAFKYNASSSDINNKKVLEKYLILMEENLTEETDKTSFNMTDIQSTLQMVMEGGSPLNSINTSLEEHGIGQACPESSIKKVSEMSSVQSKLVNTENNPNKGIDNCNNILSEEIVSLNNNATSTHSSKFNIKNKKSNDTKYCDNTGYGTWQSVKPKDNTKSSVNGLDNPDICVDNYKYEQFNQKSDYANLETESVNGVNLHPYQTMPEILQNESYFDQYSVDSQPYYNTFGPSDNNIFESYIESSKKFASMFEYVRCLGKMSYRLAKDHNDRVLSQFSTS